MKIKNVALLLCLILFVVLIGCRIHWVNQNARLPKYEYYNQSESVEYKGFSYTVTGATMMDYDDFFRENKEYIEYYNSSEFDKKIILVDYKIEKVTKEPAVIETYIPIKYEYLFNSFDPFLFNAMNPSLMEGTFKSGDKITIMYEIYESNIPENKWKQVEKFEYSLVFGVYPVRKEIKLTDIEYR